MPSNSSWFLSQMASGSMAILNNKGESGQPCRVPRLRGKYGEWTPLVFTEADGVAYRSLTQEMKLESNPNFSKIKNRKPHSTRSKAFSASSATMISGVLDVGENIMFSSLLVLKNECLPNVKPVWSNEVIDDITH